MWIKGEDDKILIRRMEEKKREHEKNPFINLRSSQVDELLKWAETELVITRHEEWSFELNYQLPDSKAASKIRCPFLARPVWPIGRRTRWETFFTCPSSSESVPMSVTSRVEKMWERNVGKSRFVWCITLTFINFISRHDSNFFWLFNDLIKMKMERIECKCSPFLINGFDRLVLVQRAVVDLHPWSLSQRKERRKSRFHSISPTREEKHESLFSKSRKPTDFSLLPTHKNSNALY